MDYQNVNNPFITLKNHKTGEEFSVDLSKHVPNVDNDPSMSNMKASNHELYSDNRATKLSLGDDVKTLGNYSITLVDIDNIIYEYLDFFITNLELLIKTNSEHIESNIISIYILNNKLCQQFQKHKKDMSITKINKRNVLIIF